MVSFARSGISRTQTHLESTRNVHKFYKTEITNSEELIVKVLQYFVFVTDVPEFFIKTKQMVLFTISYAILPMNDIFRVHPATNIIQIQKLDLILTTEADQSLSTTR